MTINFLFKNFSPVEKEQFRDYFELKLPPLEKIVSRFHCPPDAAKLEVKAEKFATKNAYEVTFILSLLKERLYVSEDDHTIREATDLAKDKLVRQLKKLKA